VNDPIESVPPHASQSTALEVRSQIDQLISTGEAQIAYLCLAALWRDEKGPATAAFVVSRAERLRDKLPFLPYRLAILRSFTVEPIVPLLRASAFCYGIDLSVLVGDFNAYAQQILETQSSLYRFAPDGVLLAVRTADIAGDLWQDFGDLASGSVAQASRRVTTSFEQWIGAFRSHSQAALIVHSLEQPARPSLGLLDGQLEAGQSAVIQQINQEMRRIARGHGGVYVLDYDALLSRHGRLRWTDTRKWLTARLPIAADQLIHVAEEWLRFIVPLCGKIAKALVVDLDNTLWGGVIGEDGMEGVKLGPEYPGAAYQAVQRVLIDLSRRGILLAVCSKNNPEEAMEMLEKHPGMLLRPQNFAALRINWHDKVQNLREIASELNIGMESIAFVDDNPVERERVRASLPEVLAIELPQDPMQYADVLRDFPGFERLMLSAEDQRKTEMYAAQRQRTEAAQTFQSAEDFFRYLEQEAEIAPLTPATLGRISQLTQKTNQFNLTTRRYTEQQIAKIAASGSRVFSIRVRDRFGDQGLVGVAITRDQGDVGEIDTFLLSCRVIGRTVETALLSFLARDAAARGLKTLRGWFFPTKKNAPAKEFYREHGFACQDSNGTGSMWVFDLTTPIQCPEWIRLKTPNGD
jgi:FkbH-like protein